MSGAWHGGKGSDPRPESEAGAFAKGYEAIDWNARERDKNFRETLDAMNRSGKFTLDAFIAEFGHEDEPCN